MEFTVGQAAETLRVPYWRIHHAYRSKKVPEPQRFNNQRRLAPDDVRRLAEHFGVSVPHAAAAEKKAGKEPGAS